MPSKFVVRSFHDNAIYHLFNRSIDGQPVFRDAQDFRVFLFYIYIYVTPSEQVRERFSDLPSRLRQKTLASQMTVVGYCLMPDHFHLLIHQLRSTAISKLMKQLSNGYTTYFNHKYRRRGPVFDGRYKAVEVPDQHLLDLIRFIHREPDLLTYEWSSYRKYLGEETFLNSNIEKILSKIGGQEKFVKFHQDEIDYRNSLPRIKSVAID